MCSGHYFPTNEVPAVGGTAFQKYVSDRSSSGHMCCSHQIEILSTIRFIFRCSRSLSSSLSGVTSLFSLLQLDYDILPWCHDEVGCHLWKQSLLCKQPVAQIAVCVLSEDGWLFELPLGYCWAFHFPEERLIRTLVAHTGSEQHPHLASDFALLHKSASESLKKKIKNGSLILCLCDGGDAGILEAVKSLFLAEGLNILERRGCCTERGWIWKQCPLKRTCISIWHQIKATAESRTSSFFLSCFSGALMLNTNRQRRGSVVGTLKPCVVQQVASWLYSQMNTHITKYRVVFKT